MPNLHRDRIRTGLLALLLAAPLGGVPVCLAATPAVSARPAAERPLPDTSRIAAVVNGHIECLRYAHEHGAPWGVCVVANVYYYTPSNKFWKH